MQSQAQYVLRTVEERGVRFVQLWFTDVLGRHKAFHVTPAELEDALDQGMTFDGSAIDGFSRVQESDVLARPDLTTFQLLPWYEEGAGVARVFCDIVNIDGTPFEGCPRQQLRRVLDTSRQQGYTFFVAPEIEFFYFQGLDVTTDPRPIDRGSYFDLLPDDTGSQLRRRTVLTLEEMGIGVEHAQHEDAPGQHEIDLRYTDALTMADTVMSVRHVVKELARQSNVTASFMPKPLANVQGSGMHTHLSLWRDEKNAFIGEKTYGLSEVASKFIAGLVAHAPEITAITNQWVNSYKRLIPGGEAPVNATWARFDSAALVRVPTVKPGRIDSTRLEYRAPDPAANPYLAFAVILAAGLRGVAGNYPLPKEGVAKAGLPQSLGEAVDLMEHSTLLQETLGSHLVEWFLRNKRAEWNAYRGQVTPFELERYLPLL
ncbi:MAG: glutamine synthetase [Acidobacteriota bacterium]|nr:glutamine synthetase [Acidobacteriota bacterium]MDE3043870.1 glutamine synthetase [Acidobacteriota bacterium]MDE3106935.1 glutamine synthetase [Acidobacteriota bacterium]